jgi:hypothetical protein
MPTVPAPLSSQRAARGSPVILSWSPQHLRRHRWPLRRQHRDVLPFLGGPRSGPFQGARAKVAITTTPDPGGPVSALEMHSPQFVMSAIASARGPRKELQD